MDSETRRAKPAAQRQRRGPKRVSAQYLDNAAKYYLERFASSSGNLRRVLMRKVARSARTHGDDPADGERLVDELIARYLRAGLIDDKAYAAQKAASLRRRGTSRYGIRGKLALKGVEADLIKATIEGLDAEGGQGELAAAAALARRRRLGPCRPAAARATHGQKDRAALARAGFGLAVARHVLALPDSDALLALERGETNSD